MIKLVGIVVVAVGFALRFNTLLVVMAAGIATGLAAGMSFNDIIGLFGKYFVENRYMTLPVVLMAPVIGLLERYGLQERAETLIKLAATLDPRRVLRPFLPLLQRLGLEARAVGVVSRAVAFSAGKVLVLYTAVRQLSISLGVNIGGHAAAVRPLVAPMAEGAARSRHGVLSEKVVYDIRAHAAAAENVGNFFGEDIFIAVGAILLMKGFFDTLRIEVGVWAMALWGIPTALVAFAAMCWRARALDRRMARAAGDAPATGGKEP